MPPRAEGDSPEPALIDRLESILGVRPTSLTPLKGGMIGEVMAVTLRSGEQVVVKHDATGAGRLDIEAAMLRHLGTHSTVPVPSALFADPTLLILEHLAGGPATEVAEPHLAELLAALHDVTSDRFGFGDATLSGTLLLPNAWTPSWREFFRNNRLRYVASAARRNGTLPQNLHDRVERIAERLDGLLSQPPRASLIHGDVWRNNVLAVGERVTGLIDPSICYADPEQELAYMALNHGFSARFFDAYAALRPIDPEFWRTRQYIYQLYPHLLHVYFFGPSRLPELEEGLRRLSA